jgi:hypothetical protein
MILSSALFITWNIVFFFYYEYFPNYFYIVPLGLTLYLSYRSKSFTNIIINTFGFILWVNLLARTLSRGFFTGDFNLISFLLIHLLIGVLLYIVGVFHQNIDSIRLFTLFFKILGYITIFITINIISISFILEEYAKVDYQAYFFVNVALIILSVGLITMNLIKGFFTSKSSKYELAVSILIILSALFILIKPELILVNTIIFNALLLVIAIITILFGFEIKRPVIFNIGIVITVLFIFSRYFNIFWGLLTRTIFFMIGGLLLILIGVFLERLRRKTIRQIKDIKGKR